MNLQQRQERTTTQESLINLVQAGDRLGKLTVDREPGPQADVRATAREYVIYLDLPGIDEDELAIDVQNNELVVSGKREFDHDNYDAEEFLLIGRVFGDYEYRFLFEGPVLPTEISAKYKRGVLRVRVPKRLNALAGETTEKKCSGNCERCKSLKAKAGEKN